MSAPMLAPGQRDRSPFEFVRVRTLVDATGRISLDFARTGSGRDIRLFKVSEMRGYDEMMTGCLRDLFDRAFVGRTSEGADGNSRSGAAR